jgi:hypothetical protein
VPRKLSARILLFSIQMMKPVLVPLFWVLDKTYDFFFARSDLRMSIQAEEQLGRDIQSKLPFLFDECGGQLIPYTLKKPRPFDYAVTRVVFPYFRLQFIRGRGEFRVRIAPSHTPNALEDLPIVLSIIDETFERREFKSFSDLEAVLKPRMKLLQDALSPDRYPALLRRLDNVHEHDRAVIRQWETEINRRLYPDK